MFCDLVDSTGISAKLDAEEWRDLVGAYLNAASAAVTEMGGKVAKKLGDWLMALFGNQVVQENDAERSACGAFDPAAPTPWALTPTGNDANRLRSARTIPNFLQLRSKKLKQS
jgi:class 3 adenylate cyclase